MALRTLHRIARGRARLTKWRLLALDPADDLSCEELWKFYCEIMTAGELSIQR
jgi:hypothetical protein